MRTTMPTEIFTLIDCTACNHMYVRSTRRDTNWDCPSCGETKDYDNLLDVPGPARDLTEEEGLELLMSGDA
jgi:hypothetical protein